jgi:hypothetical protein
VNREARRLMLSLRGVRLGSAQAYAAPGGETGKRKAYAAPGGETGKSNDLCSSWGFSE